MKTIIDFSNYYGIEDFEDVLSKMLNLGLIKYTGLGDYYASVDGEIIRVRHMHELIFECKILKPSVTNSGYLQVSHPLKKDSAIGVHRLVAYAFYGKPNNAKERMCVDHRDGNKQNNYAPNLEWVTYSENMRRYRMHKNGLTRKQGCDWDFSQEV